ncbi:MAG: NFACT RNA binding domain-containing protein [Candidatus Altiarchaeota archaeon]
MEVSLDVRKSAQENAALYYEQAKKAKKKIYGLKKALTETIKKIEELKRSEILYRKKEDERVIKIQKEKKWYEKFRYFFSSDNFLIVAGRDASSNEILIKKHMEKNDLVFHADIHGAPFFLIKNPSAEKIPESTLEETAKLAAAYSKAWQFGLGNCNVYYFLPEQISKTAPAGQYLAKGAFIISGKKNWFRNVELKISIGVIIDDEKIEIVAGVTRSIEKKCKYFVTIKPGHRKSKELAEEIKKEILRKSNETDGRKIKKIPLEEFQRWIPSGKGEIVN